MSPIYLNQFIYISARRRLEARMQRRVREIPKYSLSLSLEKVTIAMTTCRMGVSKRIKIPVVIIAIAFSARISCGSWFRGTMGSTPLAPVVPIRIRPIITNIREIATPSLRLRLLQLFR